MAEVGVGVVIAIVAVAVAFWIQALDSAVDRIGDFETQWGQFLSGVSFIIGLMMISGILIASVIAFLRTDFLGGAMAYVIGGALVWSLPYFVLILRELKIDTADEENM